MTQYQITLNEQTLQRLFGADSQLAPLLEAVLNQVLNAQVSEQLGAERYERTELRQGYRNGYKPRELTTRVGTLTLRVPQVCEGRFSPELFARYQRSEQALILTLMEMVGERRLDAQSGADHRGVVWTRVRQIDRLRSVEGPRSGSRRTSRSWLRTVSQQIAHIEC